MARLHSQILVYNDDKFSKKAVMTTKFSKKLLTSAMTAGRGPHFFTQTQSYRNGHCICQFYVVLL